MKNKEVRAILEWPALNMTPPYFEILYFQKLHRTAVCQVGAVHDDGEGGAEVPHGVHRREGRPAHSVHLCPR